MLASNFPWILVLTVGVHLVNHVLKLSLGGILPQGAHHGPQLFGGDGTITVFIKQRERLLELCKGSVGALALREAKQIPGCAYSHWLVGQVRKCKTMNVIFKIRFYTCGIH